MKANNISVTRKPSYSVLYTHNILTEFKFLYSNPGKGRCDYLDPKNMYTNGQSCSSTFCMGFGAMDVLTFGVQVGEDIHSA